MVDTKFHCSLHLILIKLMKYLGDANLKLMSVIKMLILYVRNSSSCFPVIAPLAIIMTHLPIFLRVSRISFQLFKQETIG
jgi:hypothetical protein